MLKKSKNRIILLIFACITYIIVLVVSSSFYANSYMIGFIATTIDIILLNRFVTAVLTDDKNEQKPVTVIVSIIRWAIFATILTLGFIFYNADPIAVIIGITLPFLIYISYYIKKAYRGV